MPLVKKLFFTKCKKITKHKGFGMPFGVCGGRDTEIRGAGGTSKGLGIRRLQRTGEGPGKRRGRERGAMRNPMKAIGRL